MPKTPEVFHSSVLKIKSYTPGTSRLDGVSNPIKLSSNENPFGASAKAVKAIEENLRKLHRYPDGTSTQLREAIAQNYGVEKDRIICSAGSDELISLLCDAYAGEGTEVIYSQYGFLMYPIATLKTGATPIAAEEVNFTTSVDNILGCVNEKTRLVFIANPNNPTGTYLPEAELKRLREGLPDHVILVIDTAYAEYVAAKDYRAGHELVETTNNTVVLHTFSKIYGLAALRLGWGYFPEEIADIIHRIRGPFNVSTLSQVAGIAAVNDGDFLKRSRTHNIEEGARLTEKLTDLGLTITPSVANFVLAHFPESKRYEAKAADSFLHSRGIIARNMQSYGLPNALRITVGLEEENTSLIEAIEAFLTR